MERKASVGYQVLLDHRAQVDFQDLQECQALKEIRDFLDSLGYLVLLD